LRTYILGLLGLALVGGNPVLGQSPAPVPVGAPLGCGSGCGGCAPARTVCVPEHYCKETKKWVYSSRCEPFCLCYFPTLWGGCGCGDSGSCEPPYTRRYLVKKPRICKADAVKCVPSEGPACANGQCWGAGTMCFPNTPTAYGAPAPALSPTRR